MEIREIEALNFDIGKIGFDTDALAKLFDVGEPVEREERQRDGRRGCDPIQTSCSMMPISRTLGSSSSAA
jgi:hypothetical protein